ncbi:MAG TPA: BREX system ATP-binding domain-containing protein, partial [Pseudonocardiaceae bacterium]|nr:BREX system ATP-binding domain-containing protein [Pseudonocardiaceae bacterium]
MHRAAFVGRERELAALGGLLDTARRGHGSLVLIDGEPGMGKTALANKVVHRAREQGWVTAWGSCHEGEGAPAYWPWIQILHDLDSVGDFFTEQDDGSRFRLFHEMIEVLRRSSMEGLLIVLDDLHWADLVSVRLLLILAAEIAEHRMLVLGLYRRGDLDSHGNEVLSAVARERATSRLTLDGLTRDELERLAETTLESRPEPALMRAVESRSEGNPFYALELLRLVRETGTGGLGLPRDVREAIGRRLDIVSPGTRQLLRVASVLGREFTAGQLAELAGEPVAAVLGLLDEALARDLAVVDGSHTFRFAHALIQEVAYAELPLLDRQWLHQRAAAAFDGDESAIDAFAHHLRQAASLGSALEALTATLRAAARARSQLAYEHAAFQFRQALELWPLLSDPPVAEHELLLDLARCQLRSGAVADAWQSCHAAAELGLATGQAAVVADAATVIRGTSNANANPLCGGIHALCRQALVLLDGADPVRQAKVLAQLVITRDAFAVSGGSSEMSERALCIAEASGDLDARFLALQARQVELVHPRHVLERLSIGER